MAIYSNATKSVDDLSDKNLGEIIVFRSNLKILHNRLSSKLPGADQIIWIGDDKTALQVNNNIYIVDLDGGHICIDFESQGQHKTLDTGIVCLTEVDGLRTITSDGSFFL